MALRRVGLAYLRGRPKRRHLKRRANIVIYMEILRLLLDGPKGPTRLAQAVNLNFPKLSEFAAYLEAKGLIAKATEDGHEFYSVTPAGAEVHASWRAIWDRLAP